jgi:hypothetical protein
MTRSARPGLSALLALLAAPALLLAQNARPDSHTVRPGDTLWDLSRQYLGDPFLWPEIYRLNTSVVEDPHWIYPGEVLRLVGGAEVAAVPATDTPLPPVEAAAPVAGAPVAEPPAQAEAAEPVEAPPEPVALAEPQVGDYNEGTGDARDSVDLTPLVGDNRAGAATGPDLQLSFQRAYRPIRRTEFYSSGFLTEEQALPFGTLLGLVTPLQIEEVSNRTTAQLYSRVAVTPPPGGQYQVGDTLMVVFQQREIRGHGFVVIPTGLVRVIDVSRPENLAEVIATYGPIRDQQRVLPAEKFTDPGNVRPVPISDGVNGRLLAHRDKQPLAGPQDVVFLDRGRRDGVALGDMFELRQQPRDRRGAAAVIDDIMATVQVVHVGERTSTARVVRVVQPDIPAGTEARQVAKLPS